MLTISDAAAAGGAETQTFTYDALDRLLSAQVTGGSGTYNETYSYSAIGNLTSKSDVGSYAYNAGKPHAVSSAGNNTYGYDANGNQTARIIGGTTYVLTYDAENRLVSYSGGGVTASFVYDGDGHRVKATFNGTTTVYVGDYYEKTGSVWTTYYNLPASQQAGANGQLLAYRRSDGCCFWVSDDHLHSTALVTYNSGGRQSERRYRTWGASRYATGAMATTYRFTGQREDATIGPAPE